MTEHFKSEEHAKEIIESGAWIYNNVWRFRWNGSIGKGSRETEGLELEFHSVDDCVDFMSDTLAEWRYTPNVILRDN